MTDDKLEKLSKWALHFVYQDHSSTYAALLKQSRVNTLSNQRLAKILNKVYWAINKPNISATISSLVTPSLYNLWDDSILSLPMGNTSTYILKSWTYQAARLWNALLKFRCMKNFRSFKKYNTELDINS